MAPTTMLPKLSDATQTISFSDGDGVCSAEVYSTNVMVNTNAGNHDHGSSKVKLKNLVDYNWEPKFYAGQLLAIHTNGKYLAYSIKAPNAVNPGTWSGMVRVVYNPEPGTDRRALIKGMKGEVQDLAFAHIQSQVVLACIDEQGNFYVHEIEVTDSGLRCTLLAEVREDTGAMGSSHRVVWCPYIPDDDDEATDDDVARLLLTTHDNIARMWNTRALQAAGAGSGGAVGAAGGGALCAAEHVGAILDAAFSPDGSALATASADGYVMFFQVYMHADSSPRCLHKWQPHGGKPLSCLFFLDNHKNYNTDVQFWKFAVTGAENNTTIKIWSCKSWTCLQTINFTPGVGTEMTLGLKAMLDTSASYLLLSDFKSRSLYVLNMARDPEDSMAYCKSISEFLLPYPVLSFCIVDAEEQQTKCEPSCDEPLYRNGSGGDADSPIHYELHHDDSGSGGSRSEEWRRVVVRLYIVQPKGLQEGRLVYEPPRPPLHAELLHGLSELALEDSSVESAPATIASSILQQQSQQLKNLLMRSQVPDATQPGSLIGTRPESPSIAPQLNLMTPDAFSSPGKREEDDPPLSATPDVSSKPRNSTGGPLVEETLGETASKLASAGSSPSREVQQIMSHSDHAFFKEEAEEVTVATETLSTTETLFEADVFAPPEAAPLPPHPPHPPHPHKLASTNSDTWPSISVPQVSEPVPTQQLSQSLGTLACAGADDTRAAGLSPADRTRLDALEHKLDKLTEMMSAQTRELRSLRGAVASPRDMIDEALHAHAQRTARAVESALADGWERISRVGEAASARAAQAAGVGAARALEPLAAALQHELANKMAATDQLLRENIDKLATSKTVMERLSTSIAKSLSDMVRESFREALFDSVVPVMEKTHAQIFKQINQAFQNGTKEFAANTEAAARAAAERGGAAASASLRAALERHADALAAAHGAAHHQHLADVIRDTAHSVLEKELCWWREQARSAALASRAHSPSTPHSHHAADRQMQVAQIQSLIASGDVNGAFQQALSASDLALVMCACRAAEPSHVFGPPCKLKQHVLLSLVQQLAADMGRDTPLKHRYLEEAVMNLDTTNPVTREHLPAVVRELQKQLMAFLSATPNHALARQLRMLLMATEALVKAAA
ncbi:enhancer of mRNA-decapping protein 4 isoform X1 [Helicoverpa zea]|uniref:enhancer of mRNA-decapping protein 4 isoform X1 n=1 Tax=Helicoverpa zea TaxID=7113 RepID=UPI001F57B8FB|nr:enhancer of mRNA-decapping protein 4 isoform X1 [Helicoverpa zea]